MSDRLPPKPASHPRYAWIRYPLAGFLQHVVWMLLDSWNEGWIIDYRDQEGHKCSMIRKGHYSTARACAREMRGKIIGSNAHVVPADDMEAWNQ